MLSVLPQGLSTVGFALGGVGLEPSHLTGSLSVDFFPKDQTEKTPFISLLRVVNLQAGFLELSRGMELVGDGVSEGCLTK